HHPCAQVARWNHSIRWPNEGVRNWVFAIVAWAKGCLLPFQRSDGIEQVPSVARLPRLNALPSLSRVLDHAILRSSHVSPSHTARCTALIHGLFSRAILG